MKELCLFLCAGLFLSAGARTILLPTQPVSPNLDTEVSTNIAINTGRNDVQQIDLHFQLEGTPSNNLEVAFGRDVNTNGVLDTEEIGTVYGWRSDRYFIENVPAGERFETSVVTNVPRGVCDIKLKTDANLKPKNFMVRCEDEPTFPEFATNAPPAWLYCTNWNMMRVTRRGTAAPSEWVECRLSYRYFHLRVR